MAGIPGGTPPGTPWGPWGGPKYKFFKIFEEVEFGSEIANRIELCSMLKPKQKSGYYHVEGILKLSEESTFPDESFANGGREMQQIIRDRQKEKTKRLEEITKRKNEKTRGKPRKPRTHVISSDEQNEKQLINLQESSAWDSDNKELYSQQQLGQT